MGVTRLPRGVPQECLLNAEKRVKVSSYDLAGGRPT